MQLIPRHNNRYMRRAVHLNLLITGGRNHAHNRRDNSCTSTYYRCSLLCVLACAPNISPPLWTSINVHQTTFNFCRPLYRNHCFRAWWNFCSRHNPYTASGLYSSWGILASGNISIQPETHRNCCKIFHAYCKTIHARIIERRY